MAHYLDGVYRQKITFGAGQRPPYQIVAASQGSQCGTQLFSPYAELIRGDGGTFLSPFPWIRRRSYNAQVVVNALPANGQSNRVSTLQFYTVLRLFSFINIRTNFVRQDYSCPSGLLAVDGIAGGTQYIGARLDPNKLPAPRHNSFGPFFEFNFSYSFVREFCFVPTASALDLADFNQTSFTGKFINGIASTSSSRTDGFIAQEGFADGPGTYYNQFHTTFTARNSEWMFDVIESKSFASSYCSTECLPPLTINSSLPSGRLCAGSSTTFSIPNLPAGTAVTWSTSPAGYFTPETGSGPTFTTTATGQQGTATVTALVGACQVPVTTSVGTGPAPIDGFYYCSSGCSSSTGPVQGQLSSFTIVPPGTYTLNLSTADNRRYGTWQGQVDGGNWYTYNNNASAVVTLSAGQRAQFTVPFSGSSCGAGSGTFTLAVYSSYRLVATPNPASSDLVITAVDGDQPETSTTPSTTAPPFEVELYDSRGRKVKAGKSDKGKAQVDVRELPAGLYNVRAGKGQEAISKHIEITH